MATKKTKPEAPKPGLKLVTTEYTRTMAPQKGQSPLVARLKARNLDPIVIHNQREWIIDFGHIMDTAEDGTSTKRGLTLGSALEGDVDPDKFPDVALPRLTISMKVFEVVMSSPAHRAVIEALDEKKDILFYAEAA